MDNEKREIYDEYLKQLLSDDYKENLKSKELIPLVSNMEDLDGDNNG